METTEQIQDSGNVVILHGFTKEQIFAVMHAIKRELGSSADVAFAMTTPHSLQMKLGDVVKDISQDHAYLKKNPPVKPAKPEQT